MKNTYIVLITKKKYIAGAIVLATNISNLDHENKIIALIDFDISFEHQYVLGLFYHNIINVKLFKSGLFKNYSNIIMMNGDCLLYKNISHLFETKPDIGWGDINLNLDLILNQDLYKNILLINTTDNKFTLVEKSKIDVHGSVLKPKSKSKPGSIHFYLTNHKQLKQHIQDKHFIAWYQIYDSIIGDFPFLAHVYILTQINEIYRFIKNKFKIKHNSRAHLIKYFYDSVNKLNFDYYHTTLNSYVPHKLTPMFNDIEPYDYFKPFFKLAQYYKLVSNYYLDVLELNKDFIPQTNTINKIRLDLYNDILFKDKEAILIEYIKSRPDIKIITVFPWVELGKSGSSDGSDSSASSARVPNPNPGLKHIIDIFGSYGNVYYTKTYPIENLEDFSFYLSVLYEELNYYYKPEFVNMMLNQNKSKFTGKFHVLVFDNIHKYKFTKKLNKEICNKISKNDQNIFHISESFYKSIVIGQMYFNTNTYTNIIPISKTILPAIPPAHPQDFIKFQTFKRWIYANLSLLEISRLLIVSYDSKQISGLYTSIGLNQEPSEIELFDFVSKNQFKFLRIKDKFNNVDKQNLTHSNEETHIINIITDPKYYYYMSGFKVIV